MYYVAMDESGVQSIYNLIVDYFSEDTPFCES